MLVLKKLEKDWKNWLNICQYNIVLKFVYSTQPQQGRVGKDCENGWGTPEGHEVIKGGNANAFS